MKKTFIIILSLLFFSLAKGQDATHKDSSSSHVLPRKFIDGDTLPHITMKEIVILPIYNSDMSWWEKRRHKKLIRNLKKVYPYAKKANAVLKELENEYVNINTDIGRKKYLKKAEQRLREEYEGDLRKLTISQGRLLIKLIDRETGSTTYQLVKDLRGGFSAVFWQTIARIFGSNLKSEYDAKGNDKLIEFYVNLIEQDLL